jgi:hypothetical protein
MSCHSQWLWTGSKYRSWTWGTRRRDSISMRRPPTHHLDGVDLAGELIHDNFDDWSSELREEFARNEFNYQVGSTLLSENELVKVWSISVPPGGWPTGPAKPATSPSPPVNTCCTTSATTVPPQSSSSPSSTNESREPKNQGNNDTPHLLNTLSASTARATDTCLCTSSGSRSPNQSSSNMKCSAITGSPGIPKGSSGSSKADPGCSPEPDPASGT